MTTIIHYILSYSSDNNKRKKKNKRKQNEMFKEDTRKFYREIGKNNITVTKLPGPANIGEFLKDVWSASKNFNEAALQLEEEIKKTAHIQVHDWTNISKSKS